jgi:hypothetical protein
LRDDISRCGLLSRPQSRKKARAYRSTARNAINGDVAQSLAKVVAADDAAFALPEVKRGLIAADGDLFRLPRAIPRHVVTATSWRPVAPCRYPVIILSFWLRKR